jgi:hypothetical protein
LGAVSSQLRDELGLRKRPQAPSGAAVIAGSSHIICFGVPLRSGRVDLLPLSDGGGRFMCLNGPFPRTTSYLRTSSSTLAPREASWRVSRSPVLTGALRE